MRRFSTLFLAGLLALAIAIPLFADGDSCCTGDSCCEIAAACCK